MTAEIILMPTRSSPPPSGPSVPTPMYELSWHGTGGKREYISTRDPDRIVRQMESLAQRNICARLTADGWPAGGVGLGMDGQCTVIFNRATDK